MTDGQQLFRSGIDWESVRDVVLAAESERRREVRIWTVGPHAVSDGASVAMLWRDLAVAAVRPARIVATDLALDGAPPTFSVEQASRVPAELRARWLQPTEHHLTLEPTVLKLLAVAPLDIEREPWPRQLDVIVTDAAFFARDPAIQAVRVERAMLALQSHAWLVLAPGDYELTCVGNSFVAIESIVGVYRKRQ